VSISGPVAPPVTRTDSADLTATASHEAIYPHSRTLWNLSCLLERKLIEPFDPACDRLVGETRTRLAGA